MKIRIENSSPEPLRVVLEPWATEYLISPEDHIELRSEGALPEGAHFVVEHNPGFVVVHPEWESALVYAYASNGSCIN